MAEKLSFEQSMRRLEEIARTLEQGEVGLDESIELYSQAAKRAVCQKKIERAAKNMKSQFSNSNANPPQKEEEADGVESLNSVCLSTLF